MKLTSIEEHIQLASMIRDSDELQAEFDKLCNKAIEVLRIGGKILLCGNGGSAADAQHIAAELTGRFMKERKALAAIALHANSSHTTSVANDYGYEMVFSRMVEGLGREGDLLIGFSTSGNSENIIRAAQSAKNSGIAVAIFSGAGGGNLDEWADYRIYVPSRITPRIQEMHILLGHLLCEEIDQALS